MRIGIVGSGGVGGLLAGLLARSGQDVAVVARGATLDRIRETGLCIDSPLGAFTVRVAAASSPDELPPVDAVLVAVKTWQVPAVAATLGPWLREGGFAVPLENGVDAAGECAAAIGEDRVVGGFCHMLSWAAEPGLVKHVGAPPRVTLGVWRAPIDGRLDGLVGALEGAGAKVRVAADFQAALWEKFLFIASFGGVGAVTRSSAGALRAIPETRRLLTDAFEEVRAVAAAKGITLPADVVAKTLAYVDALPAEATASLQRDIVAGRPSEIGSLSGAVARIGATIGVNVPVHTAIHAALLPQELAARR